MAGTPDGRAWVVKALHPSDPVSTVHGLPDQSSAPSTVMAYYNVYRVSCPAGETSNWGFDMTITPDVIHQACMITLNRVGLVQSLTSFLNQSLAPAGVPNPSYTQCLAQWATMGVEAHRLLGFGVTAYQDGPALSNQGTLTAAQWEVHPRKLFATGYNVTGSPLASYRITQYQANDLALYESSQHMPNAYFGESKDGCYLPLRLSHFEEYRSAANLELISNSAVTGNAIPIPTSSPAGVPPYPGITPANAVTGSLNGDPVYKPLNSIWGGISARNLSPATSFAFYFRVTVECRLTPTSVLAPQLTMSPAYDPVALASYYRISRELKDAYPADFNDLGKLWEVIKKAAAFAGRTLGNLPGPLGSIARLAPVVTSGLSSIGGMIMKEPARRQNPPAAASLERVRRAIDAPQPTKPARTSRAGPRKPPPQARSKKTKPQQRRKSK